MFVLDQVTPITPEEIVTVATQLRQQEYRFLIINCVDLGEKFDLLYHFDKDLTVKSYRMTIDKKIAVPSISSVYTSALLIENEIQDLFGLKFDNLVIDYHQTLLTVEDISAPQVVSNLNVQFSKKKSELKGGN